MLLILGNHGRLQVLGLIIAATLMGNSAGAKYEFDDCEMADKSLGVCRVFQECHPLTEGLKSGAISINDPLHCGYKGPYELICCPTENDNTWQPHFGSPMIIGSSSSTSSSTTTTTTPTTTTTTTTAPIKPTTSSRTERPAIAACRIIRDDLSPVLTGHVLGGTVVNAGEYPHMAAIGYSIGIGNTGPPYEFRCGGTLIHERFILTAAHCVSTRNANPAVVRLGMANFDDSDELAHKVDIPVKNVHVHPNHTIFGKSHDVALLEFENPVKKTRFISPTCLYTKNEDPSPFAKVFVAGWGEYNKSGKTSNVLLQARMQIVSDFRCFDSYKNQSYILSKTEHLCAADYEPENSKDACSGDSGGPLFLEVDASTLDFEQVGIISAGFGCAGSIPGLYVRVSAYLDYIESIVWP